MCKILLIHDVRVQLDVCKHILFYLQLFYSCGPLFDKNMQSGLCKNCFLYLRVTICTQTSTTVCITKLTEMTDCVNAYTG